MTSPRNTDAPNNAGKSLEHRIFGILGRIKEEIEAKEYVMSDTNYNAI